MDTMIKVTGVLALMVVLFLIFAPIWPVVLIAMIIVVWFNPFGLWDKICNFVDRHSNQKN